MPWEKFNEDMLYRLIDFAQRYYPEWVEMPEKFIHKIFKTYKDSIYVYKDGRIQGFVVYQEWPDALNFIMICLPFNDERTNLKLILQGRHLLPKKKIVWFDEKEMKGKGV